MGGAAGAVADDAADVADVGAAWCDAAWVDFVVDMWDANLLCTPRRRGSTSGEDSMWSPPARRSCFGREPGMDWDMAGLALIR
ncbi:hypothetical protein GCM10022230_00030 [Pseudoclavibacter caeni]